MNDSKLKQFFNSILNQAKVSATQEALSYLIGTVAYNLIVNGDATEFDALEWLYRMGLGTVSGSIKGSIGSLVK